MIKVKLLKNVGKMSRINKNKIPETTFLDEEESIKVSLLSYPDPKQTERMLIDVCHGHSKSTTFNKLTKRERESSIQTLIKGGALPKGLEAMGKFVFLIENISLTITHCLVRHRFFTILQRSTAVDDLRDENFVMPKSFNRNKDYYKRIKQWYVEGKKLYCEGVDKQGLSVQNARLLIPKNNCNHMFIACDLKSFNEFYVQRTDNQEEPIQNNIIAEKMKDLIIEKFPYLKDYFKCGCDIGRCLHLKTGLMNNIVFKRNKKHSKSLPKNYKENTLHDKTRDEMNAGPKIKTEHYWGVYKKKDI